jgi:hypothetical protein
MERGAGIEERVKELLASDDFTAIYIQLDLWQSPSDGFHYISVIGSFVDKEFQYREVMLGFSRFLGEHTGINMAHALFAVLKDYKIHSKLAGVTTDGATNNSVMMKRLALLLEEHYYQLPDDTLEMAKIFNENCWFHCLAHVLNLLSMELLKSNHDFTEPLMKIRKVTSIIRLSEVYRSKFIDICVRTKKSFTRPPGEVITRWNSTFLLLDWILDYKIELTEFLNANFRDASLDIRHKLIDLGSSHLKGIEMARDSDLCFTKIEWEMINLKRDILKPFMVFTEGFNQSTVRHLKH